MFLIVGLGNPGKEYEKTYHNIGFLLLDKLCEKLGATYNKKYADAIVCETKVGKEKLILAKPQTYMNLSGQSVLKLAGKFKIAPENILVVLDDVDLERGNYRHRKEGSGGTHNGLKNIVFHLGQKVQRFRIGIGNDKNLDLADYVLSKIKKEDMSVLEDVMEKVSSEIIEILNQREQKTDVV